MGKDVSLFVSEDEGGMQRIQYNREPCFAGPCLQFGPVAFPYFAVQIQIARGERHGKLVGIVQSAQQPHQNRQNTAQKQNIGYKDIDIIGGTQ